MLRTKMLGASCGIDPSMNKEAILDCVQTILDSFCAGRKTILDSASVHTQEVSKKVYEGVSLLRT